MTARQTLIPHPQPAPAPSPSAARWATDELASLAVTGPTTLDGSVTTGGNQTYNSAVTIGGNDTLTSTQRQHRLRPAVNDGTSNTTALTVSGDRPVTFGGTVGHTNWPACRHRPDHARRQRHHRRQPDL